MNRMLYALLILTGCPAAGDPNGPSDSDDDSNDTTTDTGSDGDSAGGDGITPAEPPVYSGGSCPTLTEGWNQDFTSDGLSRSFRLELPDNPENAPVVFVWHWLGGDADQILDWSEFGEFPENHGVIVVSPQTRGLEYEWDTFEGAGTPDLIFFDDMLACLSEQYAVDMARIYASGMSAGGLWTVTLTHYRSEYLAASAPLSGGATGYSWSPDVSIPVMLTWGGPRDTYGTFSFDDANQVLAEQLAEAEHFTVLCEHERGHNFPPGGVDYLWSFFEAHPRGLTPMPWVDGVPDDLPDWCSLPE